MAPRQPNELTRARSRKVLVVWNMPTARGRAGDCQDRASGMTWSVALGRHPGDLDLGDTVRHGLLDLPQRATLIAVQPIKARLSGSHCGRSGRMRRTTLLRG